MTAYNVFLYILTIIFTDIHRLDVLSDGTIVVCEVEEKGAGEDESEDTRHNEIEIVEEAYSLTRYSQTGQTLCTRRIGRNPPGSVVEITLEGTQCLALSYSYVLYFSILLVK